KLNGVDLVVCLLILLGAFGGYRDGFLMTVFSFAAFVIGIYAGFRLMGWSIVYLDNHYTIDEKWLPYVAFCVVFLLVLVVVNLTCRLLRSILHKTFLGPVDKLFGAVLGMLKTAFMLSLMLWLFSSLELTLPNDWTDDSVIYD